MMPHGSMARLLGRRRWPYFSPAAPFGATSERMTADAPPLFGYNPDTGTFWSPGVTDPYLAMAQSGQFGIPTGYQVPTTQRWNAVEGKWATAPVKPRQSAGFVSPPIPPGVSLAQARNPAALGPQYQTFQQFAADPRLSGVGKLIAMGQRRRLEREGLL